MTVEPETINTPEELKKILLSKDDDYKVLCDIIDNKIKNWDGYSKIYIYYKNINPLVLWGIEGKYSRPNPKSNSGWSIQLIKPNGYYWIFSNKKPESGKENEDLLILKECQFSSGCF